MLTCESLARQGRGGGVFLNQNHYSLKGIFKRLKPKTSFLAVSFLFLKISHEFDYVMAIVQIILRRIIEI